MIWNAWKDELRALHIMAVDWEDKGCQQFDWLRAKVCSLGLYTIGQWSKDNTFQNVYMAALFGNFGAKSLVGR
jgi:hypothetical protein